MSSRRLTFDASRPSKRYLGASPAGRNTLHTSNYTGDILSPTRALATPTRPAQRATLARANHTPGDETGLVSPMNSPTAGLALSKRNPLQAITNREQQLSNQCAGDKVSTGKYALQAAHATPQTPVSAEQQRDQKTRLAEWIYAYRRAFPSFVFYFEGIDESTAQRLSNPIRSLGAKVETFFSTQSVTHVIVAHAGLINDENGQAGSHVISLAKRSQLKIWDVNKLENRVLGILLPGYNASLVQSPSVQSAKRKLNEAFSAEKLFNMRHKTFEGSSVAHCVDFYYFKYIYVLVEDATHLHRPAIMEDYRPPEEGMEPPWPKLYMVPTGRCPFVQYEDPTTSSKSSDTDAEDNKENMTPEPEPTMATAQLQSKTPASRMCTPNRGALAKTTHAERENASKPPAGVLEEHPGQPAIARADPQQTPTRPSRNTAASHLPVNENALGIMDSNASGIAQSMGVTSTSTAFNLNAVDPVLQRSLLQNLNGGRVNHLSRLEQPVVNRVTGSAPASRSRGRAPPIPRTKKARVPTRRPAVARPGYCENCRIKFEDMLEHVKSAQHRRFAGNERNWVELDELLDRVRRPLHKPQALSSTPHLYALSSDEGSQSGLASIGSVSVHDIVSLNASGPAVQGSWESGHYSAFANMQMIASGRLSTEVTDAAGESPVHIAETSTASTPRPAASVIDLTYSNSNSPCVSPKEGICNHSGFEEDVSKQSYKANPLVTPVPVRKFNGANNDIEALVSSLETPRFRESSAEQIHEDGNTLVNPVPRKRIRYSAADSTTDQHNPFVTPTRPKAADNDGYFVGSDRMSTLVQPVRSKHSVEAECCQKEQMVQLSASNKHALNHVVGKLPFNLEIVDEPASVSQHPDAEASEVS
ncbi:Cdc7p-Dbf4p kinase complex regulatory subunit [Coemansia sp. RSA 989]|nr:Cdc7p-Dbf4p kinase complex regulatory subunit [Coemansia sp. RSA 989]KAJ2677325.1 Cdc7p-Dbf4p kinase complex regulatory subunit [Coemansia sp. RSA 1085]